jgi:hypothetical protein
MPGGPPGASWIGPIRRTLLSGPSEEDFEALELGHSDARVESRNVA